jgi:hypothetical protein
MSTSLEEARALLAGLEDVEFGGPASASDIAELGAMFELPLPQDYREFLRTFGAGAVESEEFVGLNGPAHLDARRVTARLRQPSKHASFEEHLVPLSGDGGGNYDCIDLLRSTAETSVVVTWNHAGRSGERPVIATGFWTWFTELLQEMQST